MNIAYVCDEYPPLPHGGIGTFIYSIANAIHNLGHNVTVVGFGDIPVKRVDNGVVVVVLSRSRVRFLSGLIDRGRLFCWISWNAFRGRVEVVEVPDYLGMLPFKPLFCHVIVRLHLSHSIIAQDSGQVPSAGTRLCEKLELTNNRNWIAVSNYIYVRTCSVFKLLPQNVKLIYCPVHIEEISSDNVLKIEARYGDFVLFLGMLSERKGAIILAEAGKILLPKFPGLKIIYIGKETEYNGAVISNKLREIVGSELEDRIVLLGRKSHQEALEWVAAAKVMAFPSRLESFGLVAVEAMSCGTPVAISKIGPGPEIVVDNETGVLVDPYSAADLAEKISKLLIDKVLSRKVSVAAKDRVGRRFSLLRAVNSTLDFYSECMRVQG